MREGKEFDVIGIGSCNLDEIAFVPKFTEKEEKINAITYVPPRATGVALDAITQVAYLGMRCGYIGKRGDDMLGNLFWEEMSNDVIDFSRSIVVRGERTSLCWLQVIPNGDRCHVIIPMTEKGMLTAEEIDERKDYIQSSSLCHMELMQMPVTPVYRAAEICAEAETLVSIDLDVAPSYLYFNRYTTEDQLHNLFQRTDILKVCKNAVSDLTSQKNVQKAATEILELGPKVVIITTGEQGCVVAHKYEGNDKAFECEAFTGEGIIDTTGAGDAYQGGFIYGTLKGWPVEKCAILGNACGFLKSRNVGARAMEKKELVEAFLRDERGWDSL